MRNDNSTVEFRLSLGIEEQKNGVVFRIFYLVQAAFGSLFVSSFVFYSVILLLFFFFLFNTEDGVCTCCK